MRYFAPQGAHLGRWYWVGAATLCCCGARTRSFSPTVERSNALRVESPRSEEFYQRARPEEERFPPSALAAAAPPAASCRGLHHRCKRE